MAGFAGEGGEEPRAPSDLASASVVTWGGMQDGAECVRACETLCVCLFVFECVYVCVCVHVYVRVCV